VTLEHLTAMSRFPAIPLPDDRLGIGHRAVPVGPRALALVPVLAAPLPGRRALLGGRSGRQEEKKDRGRAGHGRRRVYPPASSRGKERATRVAGRAGPA